MIVVLRWALNTRPFTRDFNDRQDVRRAATQSHPFSASYFHSAQIQRRGLKCKPVAIVSLALSRTNAAVSN
jgi:hypothetical protein